jgi:hypothetical protein
MTYLRTLKSFPGSSIYFSTCGIEDETVKEKPYVRHRITIRRFYTIENAKDYLIF